MLNTQYKKRGLPLHSSPINYVLFQNSWTEPFRNSLARKRVQIFHISYAIKSIPFSLYPL